MSVHICTIGWEDEERIIGPMIELRPSKVYLVYGKRNRLDPDGLAKKNAERIKEKLGVFVASEFVEVDPHNLLDAFQKIDSIIKKEKEVYINFTSGTKILIGAALMASVVHASNVKEVYYGKPKEYIPKKLGFSSSGYDHKVSLPIFTSEFGKIREDQQLRSILRILLNEKKNGYCVSSVEELTKLSEPEKYETASKISGKEKKTDMARVRYQLGRLEDLNYVSTVRERKRLRICLTDSGIEAAAVILGMS